MLSHLHRTAPLELTPNVREADETGFLTALDEHTNVEARFALV